MKKPFLLIAGAGYYPRAQTRDWKGCFETKEEAEEHLKKIEKLERDYFDWHVIVDLREWTEV